jgi:tetratricopeptide (TPR) repeat protein
MAKPSSSASSVDVFPVFLGLAVVTRDASGRQRLRVRWAYVAGAIVGGAALAWVLIAMGLYYYFKLFRDFEDVRFTEMLALPFKYESFQHELGEYHLRMGDEHLKNGRVVEAMNSFRLGLIKVPDNLHARQMLAGLYLALYHQQELDRSLTILELGLPYAHNDPSYINSYLQALEYYHRDAKAIAVCEQMLNPSADDKDPPISDQVRRILALNLASFRILNGDFDKADDVIEKYHLTDSIEGVLMAGQSMWGRGRRKSAVDYLQNALQRFPNNDSLYAVLARYYRDLGDLDRSRQYTVLRAINAPMSVSPRIDLLYIMAKSGENDQVESEAKTLIEQFNADQNAMLLLANFATDQGDVALARRIYERAVENKFDLTAFSLLLIEANLSAGDFDGALRFIDEIDQERPDWLTRSKSIFDSLRAVANYGKGRTDQADVFLTDVLKDPSPSADTLVAIANRFQILGGYNEAQQLLQTAYHRDPNNQSALIQLITVDLQLGSSTELETNLLRLLEMRNPPLELILDAYRKLGSDRFIFVARRQELLNKLNGFIQDATTRRENAEA